MLRFLFCLLFLVPPSASAEGTAGDFDYYVLSLSWSPNWCELEGNQRQSPQCSDTAGFGWVLHGLWPQYENGWPSYCDSLLQNPTRRQTAEMADIMGSAGSAWHQWNKHGTCSGLESADYFSLARQAYEQIIRPELLRNLTREVSLPARLIEEAFLRDNPEIDPDGLTVTCKSGAIQEVRICLTRDLDFRLCGRDVRRDCTMNDAVFQPIPPVN